MQQLIQVDKETFLALVEEVVSHIRETDKTRERRWVDGAEAMTLLGIKSRSSLQRLRDGGKIRYSQMDRIILYDRQSIIKYIEQNVRETF